MSPHPQPGHPAVVSGPARGELTAPPLRAALILNALDDITIKMLLGCGILELVIGITMHGDGDTPGWLEGVALLVTVAVVVLVNAVLDFQKQMQFRALNAANEQANVMVTRGGVRREIDQKELLVGDLVHIDYGQAIPADGLYVDGESFEVTEASLTGEPDNLKKNRNVPFIFNGTTCARGKGTMLVCAVGWNTHVGQIKAQSEADEGHEDEEANAGAMEKKLLKMTELVVKIGAYAALLVIVILLVRFCIDFWAPAGDGWEWDKICKEEECPGGEGATVYPFMKIVKIFTIAVTVLVVAVPEGLPLAVTISLAFSVMKMMKDNNLVRHMAACEVMGTCTTICSDKTGTLTQNRMTVVACWWAGAANEEMQASEIDPKLKEKLGQIAPIMENMTINTSDSAFLRTELVENPHTGKYDVEVESLEGNKTDCGLLKLARLLGAPFGQHKNANKQKKTPVQRCMGCGEPHDMCMPGEKVTEIPGTSDSVPEAREEFGKGLSKQLPFDSKEKRMITIIPTDKAVPLSKGGTQRVLCKGAAEWVLEDCDTYMNEAGETMFYLTAIWCRSQMRTRCTGRESGASDG